MHPETIRQKERNTESRRFLAIGGLRPAACLLACALLVGCATPGYRTDRWRDAKDVFTFTGGWGIGAKVRSGPVSIAPLLFFNDATGLRGGTTFTNLAGPPAPVDYGVEDVGFLVFSGERFGLEGPQRGILAIWENHKDLEEVQHRGKALETCESYVPFLNMPRLHPSDHVKPYVHYPFYYFTQVEACIACGPGIRVGVNPGELIDLILGFATIDILNDDIGDWESNPSAFPSP